ncbi:hypothetical protein GQ473_04685 [archaeon]|nr:hypothetical protein [archaeon]
MSKHYVDDIGTIITVNCVEDISAATTTEFKIKKPDGSITIWPAVVYNSTYMRYTTISGDFDTPGVYILQSHVILPTWQGLGDSAEFTIYQSYK